MFYKTKLTKYLTFGFASAITLYPFVLVNPHVKVKRSLVIHEKIHLKQQFEMLVIPFYFFYICEYFFRLIFSSNHYLAYRNISFEREAYTNQENAKYLKKRKLFSWIKYIRMPLASKG